MARHATRRARRLGPREWALRGGLAVTTLALGYASTMQTLAYAIAKANPERGHVLAPWDGRITALLAQRSLKDEASVGDRQQASGLARQALTEEPLAIPAVTVLALNAQLAGDSAKAERLFRHSDRVSRRELPARLWMIENAVQRNDIPQAIRHYDIALRTSKEASELLFPILSTAIEDPTIARVVAATYVNRPPWGDAFIFHLSGSNTSPETNAAFFRMLSARGIAVPEVAQAAVVNALVAKGAFEDGWTYYRTWHRTADRHHSRDPDFAAGPRTPTEFDWTPVMNDPGVTATFQHTDQGGIFDFATSPTVGGIVLQQLQLLPAGKYRLKGVSAGIDQPHDARPYWVLACTDGREIGRFDLPNSSENGGRFVGKFEINEDSCRAQILRLVLRPSAQLGGVTGQIERAVLQPL